MAPPSRETRLLLATIAIAVGMLLLLARFRFPDEGSPEPVQPAPAPLARLAAGATYDEMAAIMSGLEARLAPRVTVLRVTPARPDGPYVVAPRIAPDRSVLVIGSDEALEEAGAGVPEVVSRDRIREIAVLGFGGRGPESTVAPVSTTLRPGPRYVAVVEGSARGPVVRPNYIGRTDLIDNPRRGGAVLSVSATQPPLPRGAAVFSLAGNLIGLVIEGGTTPTLVGADVLKGMAEAAESSETTGTIAVQVQGLSAALSRATGASAGVVVSSVHPAGPAADRLEPGDVITEIDGSPVKTPADFQQLVQGHASGSDVLVRGVRMGAPLFVLVVARSSADGPLPPAPPSDDPGLVLRTIPRAGTLVEAVSPDMSAYRAGVQAGDVIVSINGQKAPSAAAIERAFREAKPGDALVLAVRRGPSMVVIALEKGAP